MMEMFCPQDLQSGMFWYDAYEAPPVKQSAFVAYTEGPRIEFGAGNWNSGWNRGNNMNKRMVEFLRRSWHPKIEIQEHEKERGFRHMMNERARREKQKQSYMALHSVLPFGTKSDKSCIIQTAAKKIQELQRRVEELKRRNKLGVEASMVAVEGKRDVGVAKIRVRVPNPASGVDSMVEVLQFLKTLGLKTRTIRSNFSAQEFSAELEIETEMVGAADDAEKAIDKEITLLEAERKLLLHFDEEG
ncbi:transcription factor bHLH92-like [Juglans microcarpa x Juglans regia]|uniref:transcription factor bHLH92-like n=1 Tax=Juglans microcarpa x Juglans regia TaxID=2249226 RepID=UPI001B7EE084|nr:transcription factor bHLH92-like [Juglans microcarpa x Juglans regia]